MDRKTNYVIVLMAAFAALATYNIAYGLKMGEIRGRLHWVALDDDPTRFWNIVVGNGLNIAASLALMWLLNSRSRN
ncbi:hypothetical protein [Mesorhizobium sp. GbtcB19]|uniref:hypothetical protein n=1 Tax=Mesorhizobium sp. GbtcB19 TaxID=2824764 RepID=UPI001C30982E|nr:hypothetical protein [Mesorhizobium sp. GbtcB19]